MGNRNDSQQYSEVRVRLKIGRVKVINNICSWLGLKPTEYVSQLIDEDIKKQPEKYRLTKKEELA